MGFNSGFKGLIQHMNVLRESNALPPFTCFVSPNYWGVKNKNEMAGNVACMGNRQGLYMVLSRPEGKPHLEGLGVDRIIILKGSARRGMGAWTVSKAVMHLLSFTKCKELFDLLRNC
jgi:hypothetical protein